MHQEKSAAASLLLAAPQPTPPTIASIQQARQPWQEPHRPASLATTSTGQPATARISASILLAHNHWAGARKKANNTAVYTAVKGVFIGIHQACSTSLLICNIRSNSNQHLLQFYVVVSSSIDIPQQYQNNQPDFAS
jgi:hypothetical protein